MNQTSITIVSGTFVPRIALMCILFIAITAMFAPAAYAQPAATTMTATDITTTSATLNGTVNANGASTTVTFEYGLPGKDPTIVSAVPPTVIGSTDTSVSLAISSLQPGTTYSFRVVATNANGTTYGSDLTFITLGPTAITLPATNVTSTSATLNGSVFPNGADTTVSFEYGTDTNYGTTAPFGSTLPGTLPGPSNIPVAISDLAVNVTYHYRIVATNADGTTYGADMTFTTSTTTVITLPATNVTASTATLNGTVNAGGLDTTVEFEYGTTPSFGTTVAGTPSPVTGTTATSVSAALTGLSPGEYYFRVVGQNSAGTVYGNSMMAMIGVTVPPTVTTNAASGVSTSGATLNGSVNPNRSSTNVTFEYGLDTSYGTTVTADQSPVDGVDDIAVSKAITGLSPDTTYHFRAVGQNSAGTAYGADMTFITVAAAAPTATTQAATEVTATSATLNATVNANSSDTTVYFQYGTTPSFGTTVAGTPSPVTGATDTSVSTPITGLTANTTYYYRVWAYNAISGYPGVYGTELSFTTPSTPTPPTVVTDPATDVGTISATLNGTVNANNDNTTVSFEYGLDTSYGKALEATPNPVTGATDTAISASLPRLEPNTTYHYRAVGENGGGTTYGDDMTFTTTTVPPTVTTDAASGISTSGATLNGTVNANNDTTTVTFEYGLTTSYGTTTTAVPGTATGLANTPVSLELTGLSNDTTYHYRVVGQNSAGTTYGADMTFTTGETSPPTVTTNAATDIGVTSATLNGTVNANNSSTMVTIEYGTTTSYTRSVTLPTPVTGMVDTPVSTALTSFQECTTYHYRVVGQNSAGTTYGDNMTFTTKSCNFLLWTK